MVLLHWFLYIKIWESIKGKHQVQQKLKGLASSSIESVQRKTQFKVQRDQQAIKVSKDIFQNNKIL